MLNPKPEMRTPTVSCDRWTASWDWAVARHRLIASVASSRSGGGAEDLVVLDLDAELGEEFDEDDGDLAADAVG